MKVKILREAGYEEALMGLSLSYDQLANLWTLENMPTVARRLAHLDGGHNKFLESMVVWLDITAPRYWWQQFDTYRVGISKQSESTMHTLMRGKLVVDDFEDRFIPMMFLRRLNEYIQKENFTAVKTMLPEGFLQRRIVCANYKALRHIVGQRADHRLSEWQIFCGVMQDNLQYAEFI